MDVLKKIPHRHFVFSIPKILRRYFLYDRKLLADLSRCAWESLKAFLQDAVLEDDPVPGAVIAMQTSKAMPYQFINNINQFNLNIRSETHPGPRSLGPIEG